MTKVKIYLKLSSVTKYRTIVLHYSITNTKKRNEPVCTNFAVQNRRRFQRS